MNVGPALRGLREKHGQTLVSVVVFGALMRYAVLMGTRSLAEAWYLREFDFVEIAFFLHNLVLCTLVLVRRQHRAMDRTVAHQCVALVAFFSGILFVEGEPPGAALLGISQAITIVAIVLGTVAILNLGRSFGILIAIRKIKTRGLYSIIRHPVYFIDTLWRTGIVVKSAGAYNLVIFVASTAAYVYRALLEEKFLQQYAEYREYMNRVRYRFIPGIF